MTTFSLRMRRRQVRPTAGWACTLIVLLALAGCVDSSAPPEALDAASDSLAVAVDTAGSVRGTRDAGLVTSTAAVDTAQTRAPVTESPPPASAGTVAGRLDVLIRDIGRLEAKVDGMGRRLSAIENARPAAVDTAKATARGRVKETAQDVQNFGLRAFWAVIVMVAAFAFIKFLVWLLETLSERSARRRLFFKKLIPIARILVWTTVVYYVISGVFEVDKEGLLAAGAAVGVAVGFAAQDVLKNIFGGILIILDQPFQVGDRVSVGGTYGEVVSIGLRSTRIVTPDDNLVTVPNTQVVDGQVANANAGALDCQVVTELFLPGWVDVNRAKEIAYDAAANSKFVYLKKPIVVLIKDEFKETFLTRVVVKAYVIDARYEAVFASDVTETAKSQYLREGMLAEFYPGALSVAGPNGSDAAEHSGGHA